MSVDTSAPDTSAPEGTDLRSRALARLQQKRAFRLHLLMYLLFNAVLVGIWALTWTGFFWPGIPIAAWGIGVVAHAYEVYGREPTEEQIRREMERIG